LAQTAGDERTGAVRSAEDSDQRGYAGTDPGQRRATPHRLRRGRGDAPPGAGRSTAMMHLPASVRAYLCLSPCDMRRSFDGLHALCGIIWNWILSPDTFTCSPTSEEIGSRFCTGTGRVRHLGCL